ncbi:HPr kinase [Sphingomonas oligophenolica]|uniref:Serine kinase n=1 Tax=Sphingomonas oligophenolica TaxID=301154 RepID=A0ABU9XWY6_9SPHN
MTHSASGARPRHLYSVFGLTLCSEIELPELQPVDGGNPDVEISYGKVAVPGQTGELVITADGAILVVAQAGRYQVQQGRRIVVDPAGGAAPRTVRLFLLGSAFGVLLHQRGLLPLHANAIAIDGRAIAFTGASGAGKSTLAALFHDRGHFLLSDDVCVIGADPAGRPIAHAGIPHMRLWRDALERSGRSAADFESVLGGRDKFTVPARRGDAPAAMPLGAIYVLKKAGEGGGGVAIRRLHGAAAFKALVANTYRGRYIAQLGDARRHWAASLELVATVPVFELERPWSPAWMPATLDAVEAHLRAGPE